MLRTFLIAAILPLLIFIGCDSTKHSNTKEEIIALERSALDKWAQSNTMGYVDISAEDVTWFDFSGAEQPRVEGRDAVKKFLTPLSGQIPPHKYEIVNPKVQVYENCAILTFHWKAVMMDGTPLPIWKATSVYNWRDGKWQQVHANWSELQGT